MKIESRYRIANFLDKIGFELIGDLFDPKLRRRLSVKTGARNRIYCTIS